MGRAQKRIAPGEAPQMPRWVELIDASGDRFLFSDQSGSWRAFDPDRDSPPQGAKAISAKVPFELEADDPDNELIATILAKRFREAIAEGKPLSQEEIDKAASRAAKYAQRLPGRRKDELIAEEEAALALAPASPREGLTPLQMIGWIGIPVVGLALYINYRKRR